MCVGDIVLITDENTRCNQWRIGRVVEACADEDELVRKVKLRVETPALNSRGELQTVSDF